MRIFTNVGTSLAEETASVCEHLTLVKGVFLSLRMYDEAAQALDMQWPPEMGDASAYTIIIGGNPKGNTHSAPTLIAALSAAILAASKGDSQ